MCDIISRLPNDIIYYIIPYTYHTQSKEMLFDIQSYIETKNKIHLIYDERWHFLLEENADKDWLINDLFSYLNKDHPTMFGYTDDFYKVFYRNHMLKNKKKEEIDTFIHRLEGYDVNTQITIFWGIMTPMERTDFIQKQSLRTTFEELNPHI